MNITKFIHSCLLIEIEKAKILIDPGVYSYQAININLLKDLNYLLITHEHADHMHIPFIKEILMLTPAVKIITNPSVGTLLEQEKIPYSLDDSNDITFEEAPHEKIFLGETPHHNTSFTIFNTLTHPGDSHHFTKTAKILALPVQAPWGSTTQAVDKALDLHPQYIIPIHDWHWNDQARISLYGILKECFAKNNIQFLSLETGITVEVD